MRVLAIDPGNIESAWVLVDTADCRPIVFDKAKNTQVRDICYGYGPAELDHTDEVVIEMVASYGMAVGREVFETCVWIGRFAEAVDNPIVPCSPELVYRKEVKLHHCGQTKAKDSNIVQALVDRFTPGQPNYGKGTKSEPGWFHGFTADVWQAYALAVLAADRIEGRQGVA